jgi:hypothetical protein
MAMGRYQQFLASLTDEQREQWERIIDSLDPPSCYESVPSGVRWFCGECTACISGFSEVDEAKAMAAMDHDDKCRWLYTLRLLAVLDQQWSDHE